MNSKFKLMTLTELYAGLFVSDAYKNFIPKYRSLLLEPIVSQNENAVANRDPDLIEAAAAEVAQLIPQAFGIFKLITERPGDKNKGSDFITTQKALHEYMFKTLYHINRNCRTLLEAQLDYDRVDSLEAHLRILKKKYALLDEQLLLIGLKWHETDEKTFYSLVERENKLKAFDSETDGVCFQIYNDQNDEELKVPNDIRTANGLVISRRYFFFGIFRIFQHLQLNTQICELEKTGVATVEASEEAEVGTYLMDAFNQAAKEIL
jgi:hypothetical protein